jgi:hypothetical protein
MKTFIALLEMLYVPARALDRDRSARSGAWALVFVGLTWSALLLALDRGGHAPSFVLGPLPKERYYAAQALFVTPLLVLLAAVLAVVAHGAARALGGCGRLAQGAGRLGLALAAPLLLYVLVDAAVYAAAGFGALGPVARVGLPFAFLWTLALSALALRRVYGLRLGRALLAAFAGLLAAGALGGPFLR